MQRQRIPPEERSGGIQTKVTQVAGRVLVARVVSSGRTFAARTAMSVRAGSARAPERWQLAAVNVGFETRLFVSAQRSILVDVVGSDPAVHLGEVFGRSRPVLGGRVGVRPWRLGQLDGSIFECLGKGLEFGFVELTVFVYVVGGHDSVRFGKMFDDCGGILWRASGAAAVTRPLGTRTIGIVLSCQ